MTWKIGAKVVHRNTRPVLFANTCYNLLQLLLLTTTAQTTFFTEMLSIKANTFFGQFMLFPFFPFHRVFSYHLASTSLWKATLFTLLCTIYFKPLLCLSISSHLCLSSVFVFYPFTLSALENRLYLFAHYLLLTFISSSFSISPCLLFYHTLSLCTYLSFLLLDSLHLSLYLFVFSISVPHKLLEKTSDFFFLFCPVLRFSVVIMVPTLFFSFLFFPTLILWPRCLHD
jgi:hypothetical protein